MSSDEIIGGFNTAQEVELQRLIHQLRLSDGVPSTSASALVAPPSPNRMSLMMLYFPDEIDEHMTFFELGDIMDGVVPHDKYLDEILTISMSQIDEIVQPELASLFNLFGVSLIEVPEEIHTAPASGFSPGDPNCSSFRVSR